MNFTQLQGHLRTRCAQNRVIYLCLSIPECSPSRWLWSLPLCLCFLTSFLHSPVVLSPLPRCPFSTPPSSFLHSPIILSPPISVCPALPVTLSCRRSQMGNSAPSALLVSVLGRIFPPGKHSPSPRSPPSSLPLYPPSSLPLTPALSVSPFCCFLIPCYIYTPALSTPMELLAMAARF